MVEDRITDGKRIAELLASELTGLDRPPLDRIAVVDAAPDATPSPDGTLAYRVTVDGDAVGEVRMYPERVEVELSVAAPPDARDGDRPSLDMEADGEAGTVRVESGAAVKRARDVLAAVAENR